MTMRLPCSVLVLLSLSLSLPVFAVKKTTTTTTADAATTTATEAIDLAGLDPALFVRARRAWQKARATGRARRERLVVIDYSRPSTQERLWVFDLERETLLFKELVAHGKNTGADRATRFSNTVGSLQTSVGVFVTGDVYRGEHGKSLRLDGLEAGFNDKARERAIVIHAADYVDAAAARKQGRLGRSWGCPALRPAVASSLIDAVADGAVVFAWGDDADWQARSTFLR